MEAEVDSVTLLALGKRAIACPGFAWMKAEALVAILEAAPAKESKL